METTFLHDACCPQATQSLETIEIIMGLAAEGVYAAAESGGVQDIEKGGTGYARLGELIGTAHIEQNGVGIGTECLTEMKGIEFVGFCTAHTGGKQGNERKGKEFLLFHLVAVVRRFKDCPNGLRSVCFRHRKETDGCGHGHRGVR